MGFWLVHEIFIFFFLIQLVALKQGVFSTNFLWPWLCFLLIYTESFPSIRKISLSVFNH